MTAMTMSEAERIPYMKIPPELSKSMNCIMRKSWSLSCAADVRSLAVPFEPPQCEYHVCVHRFDLQSPLIRSLCLFPLAGPLEDLPLLVVCFGHIWLDLEGFVQFCERLGGLPLV